MSLLIYRDRAKKIEKIVKIIRNGLCECYDWMENGRKGNDIFKFYISAGSSTNAIIDVKYTSAY